ncbi:hypothetical protein KDK_76670 [Dictyobacter kobayashii]|uniref:Extracellular solute-binding protein n=2 Tax=Dictyobacter kobayashii TaxID=2014872 RepID=A0A402AXP6_9CHLR|nr:hypothetical protein KDK_76670 [Dictyobacter kobayashii]
MAKNPNYGITPIFTIKQSVITGGVNSLAVYKGSKNQQAAWQFLKWATQTNPEISFAKFSDIPAEKNAFSQLSSYLQPPKFAPTMETAFQSFQPSLMTTKDQLATTLGDIITDMMAGKLTPAQAAAKMEQQGNSILASA